VGKEQQQKRARKMKSGWERKEEEHEVHCGGGEANCAVVVWDLKKNRFCRGREVVQPPPPGKNACGGHEGFKEDGILGK